MADKLAGPPPAASTRRTRRPRSGPGVPATATMPGPALPYLLVLAGGAAGIGWIARGGFQAVRGGTFALAGAMCVAAIARLVLPDRRIGMLATRKRATDVVTLAAAAASLVAAGVVLPPWS